MAIISLPNGLGAALGDYLATTEPLLQNGDVWYVDSSDGDDTYDGRDRIKPLATLGQAVTNGLAGDIIVLKDGHTETLTAAVDIAGFTVVGCGSSGGYPTVKLTNNQDAAAAINCSGSSGEVSQLLNIWFEEQAKTCSAPNVLIGGNPGNAGFVRIRGCYFEANGNDEAPSLELGGSEGNSGIVIIENTTFISTSTTLTTQPLSAIESYSSTAPEYIVMNGVVVDGGTVGWSNYFGIDLTDTAPDIIICEALSLLRGSDMKLMEATIGFVNAATVTGGSRIDWADVA
jgi:hypothetical protein